MQAGSLLMRWRVCLLLALGVLLTACSGTTFVYNRLDFLVPWYLERYVDLDRAQSEQFDVMLAPLLEWHRYEELPRYVAFIDDIERDLSAPLTVGMLNAYAQRAEQAWIRLRDPALEKLLVLAESLSDEQLEEFVAELDDKQQEYEEEYLERQETEFREDAYDRLEDMMEDYLGGLTPAQEARVELAAQTLRRSDSVWLGERSAWTAAVEVELARRPGWQSRIRTLVRDWEDQLDPEVDALYEHNERAVQAAIVDVVNARNERQDRRLRSKLADYREDFVYLAGLDKEDGSRAQEASTSSARGSN